MVIDATKLAVVGIFFEIDNAASNPFIESIGDGLPNLHKCGDETTINAQGQVYVSSLDCITFLKLINE
jgi:hypothetical protein